MPSYSDSLPQTEALLLDYAKQLNFHRQGRSAICLRVSLLRPDMKKPTDINLMVRKCRDLAYRYQGEIFHLGCGDVVLTLKDSTPDIVNSVLDQICRLFRHDPLVQKDRDAFVVRYEMETQYNEFLDYAKITKHHSEDKDEAHAAVRPLELDRLDPAFVQTATGFADPEDLVIRKSIYKLDGDNLLLPVFTEVSVDPDKVVDVMLKGVDAHSNPELVIQGYRLMECRVLSAIAFLAAPWATPWALQLGLAALGSFNFMIFDRAWRQLNPPQGESDPRFVICYEDIRAQPGVFAYLQHFMAGREYPLWVSGVDRNVLAMLDLGELGVEKVKLSWPGSREEMGLTRTVLAKAIGAIGPEHVILTGCEHDRSLDLARELGITHVEGTYADAVFHGEKIWKVA